MSEWLPIETAPGDGTPIDVWVKSRFNGREDARRMTDVTWGEFTTEKAGKLVTQPGWVYWSERLDDTIGVEECGTDSDGNEWYERVTHWMPLPGPPEEKR